MKVYNIATRWQQGPVVGIVEVFYTVSLSAGLCWAVKVCLLTQTSLFQLPRRKLSGKFLGDPISKILETSYSIWFWYFFLAKSAAGLRKIHCFSWWRWSIWSVFATAYVAPWSCLSWPASRNFPTLDMVAVEYNLMWCCWTFNHI